MKRKLRMQLFKAALTWFSTKGSNAASSPFIHRLLRYTQVFTNTSPMA